MKLVVALMKVYRREGQGLADFKAEINALMDADRLWFVDRFAIEYPDWGVVLA